MHFVVACREFKQEFRALYVYRNTVDRPNRERPAGSSFSKGAKQNKGYRIPGIFSYELQEARGWKLAFESIGAVVGTVHRAVLPHPNNKAPNHAA